jgi:hypothetical protein
MPAPLSVANCFENADVVRHISSFMASVTDEKHLHRARSFILLSLKGVEKREMMDACGKT